jgi:hypothetical protein
MPYHAPKHFRVSSTYVLPRIAEFPSRHTSLPASPYPCAGADSGHPSLPLQARAKEPPEVSCPRAQPNHAAASPLALARCIEGLHAVDRFRPDRFET